MRDVEKIKKILLSALVADDIFLGILVLKGGNALNLAYDISNRGSIDIDFSMAGDFTDEEKNRLRNQIDTTLNQEFEPHGLFAFDVKFEDRPGKIDPEIEDFWGGYMLSFKLIEIDKKDEQNGDIDAIRRNAIPIGKNDSTIFTVDISKYEYVGSKKTVDLEGSIIQVYSPEMLAIEKIRAICQQNPKYSDVILRMKSRPRARDFYDIVTLKDHFNLDFSTSEIKELVQTIFDAKKVPLSYLLEIEDQRDFHAQAWESVLQTIDAENEVESFDYYFDSVKEIVALTL